MAPKETVFSQIWSKLIQQTGKCVYFVNEDEKMSFLLMKQLIKNAKVSS